MVQRIFLYAVTVPAASINSDNRIRIMAVDPLHHANMRGTALLPLIRTIATKRVKDSIGLSKPNQSAITISRVEKFILRFPPWDGIMMIFSNNRKTGKPRSMAFRLYLALPTGIEPVTAP